jgi:predicted transport protein
MENFLVALGDDVTKKITQDYIAFRRIKNFACIEVRPQKKTLVVYLKVDVTSTELEKDFTRDVRSIGHWGTGDLEVTLTSLQDLERAKSLLTTSYENS